MLRYRLDGDGPCTAVLFHELGGSLESWDLVTPDLGHHLRLLAFDARGAGGSEKIAGAFTFEQSVADARGVIRDLGLRPPFLFIGLAAGAAVALALAAEMPAAMAGLVIAGPTLHVTAERAAALRARADAVEEGGMRAVAESTLAVSFPPIPGMDPAIRQEYRSRFLANCPTSYAALNRAAATIDMRDAMAQISAPVLVLHGRQEGLRSATTVRTTAANLVYATFCEIEGSHIAPLQAPEAFTTAILDFLASIAGFGDGIRPGR